MAVAMGAIKGFFHIFTDSWLQSEDSPRHIVTILDVLEPRNPQS